MNYNENVITNILPQNQSNIFNSNNHRHPYLISLLRIVLRDQNLQIIHCFVK